MAASLLELVQSTWTSIGPWGRRGIYALAFVYVLWALIYLIQARLLYFTDPTRRHPPDIGLENVREEVIETPDGETLVLWRAEPAWKGAPHVLYLHGNRRALWRRARFFRMFVAAGWGFTALAHRGFNGSTGRPSEKKNVADAILVCDHLARQGVDLSRLVVYGESLGSGTAVQVAAARGVGGVILHAPYDSLAGLIFARTLFLLPRAIVRERYRSIDVIGTVSAPLLWIHGDDDRVIPLWRGRRLYDAAPGPKYAALVKGANHFGIYTQQVFNQHIRLFGEGMVAASRLQPETAPASVIDPVIPDEDGRPELTARDRSRRKR